MRLVSLNILCNNNEHNFTILTSMFRLQNTLVTDNTKTLLIWCILLRSYTIIINLHYMFGKEHKILSIYI